MQATAAVSRASSAFRPAGLRPQSGRPSSSRRTLVLAASSSKPEVETSKPSPLRPLAAFGAAALSLGVAAAAHAAGQPEIQELEQELNSSFAVDLGGFSVDHKTLIYGVFVGQWVALIGAAVGGWTSRQRALEVQELNAKLTETNRKMRKQMNREVHITRTQDDEDLDEVITLLRQGKSLLKEKKAVDAKATFERALVRIASAGTKLDSPWKAERKARRGIGAAACQLKDYAEAEKNFLRVVELCETMLLPGAERPELADAYGVLADMYTEWGKLDRAGQMYDKMIGEMATA
mmetsp:Transcript_18462/g.51705  ORF Transcript_18462/g.51705 Transcript_18462/m.51705 type:complete len:292 (+) Transcript_18462:133-1008(+)